jgi:branched-chain amino acid transport system permease protein
VIAQLATIAASSGIYALLGIGIVIIYRASRVLNIAQGELAILVAYIAAALLHTGLPLWASAMLALAIGALLGAAICRFFVRPVMGEAPHVGLIITVGLAIVLQGIMVTVFGGRATTLETGFSGALTVGGERVAQTDLVAAAGAWACVAAILAINALTGVGLQMRAVAERVILSAQRGVNVERIVALSWVIAGVAAAAGGMLHGQRSLITVTASIVGIKALIACLIGGMNSLWGVVLGSILVAAAEDLAFRGLGPRYALLVPILGLLVVLSLKPWGLFGTQEDMKRV